MFTTAVLGDTKATFTNSAGLKELVFNVYAKETLKTTSGVLINNSGGYAAGVTSFTTDGNNANDHYSINQKVIDQYKRVLGIVKTVSANTITFRAGTAFGVGNNDILYKVNAYPNRVSGGRIYIRPAETTEDWSMIADIDITKGVRASLSGDYLPWVQDNDNNAFRITKSTEATTRAQSDLSSANWGLKLANPNLDTYSSLNGFSQSSTQIAFGQAGSGFKTAVVCNRRAFVANVKYNQGQKNAGLASNYFIDTSDPDSLTDLSSETGSPNQVFEHFGDRIMFSEVGKYDTFPNTNFIDVVKGDGEDYVKLEVYSDRLLAFKQRTLQILNVASPSPANWFLEDTVQFAGVANPYSVCKGENGIIWANQNGLFGYSGQNISNLIEGKISADSWATFCADKEMALGYDSKEDQVIIIDKASFAQHAYIFNLKTNSFAYGIYAAPNAHSALSNASSFEPIVTNFVNDSAGQLIVAYDTQGLDIGDAGANTIHTTKWVGENTVSAGALTSAKLVTKDFLLGSSATLSKVYKVYIHYRSTLDVTITAAMVYYQIDQSGTWIAFNSGSMPRSLDTGSAYDIAVFTPSATFECQSIAIKIDSTVTTQLYINDIQIEHREIRKRIS